MISLSDYLMGRDKDYPPSEEQIQSACDLLERIAELEDEYAVAPFEITSGYRPAEINATIAGSKAHDSHERCAGIDLRDRDKKLSDWLVKNQDILEMLGLWMESPVSAKDHVHLQSYAPRSGRRVFLA